MVVLVASETLLIVLLTLLIVALLRSHAEILRRLAPAAEREPDVDPRLPSAGQRAGAREASDVAGATPSGDALKIALGHGSPPTLLAFLSADDGISEPFWTNSRPSELPPAVRVVLIAHDPGADDGSRLHELQPETVPVVMSSAAWLDYAVPGAPYFVYIEGGYVRGEGSATGWPQIASLLRDAIADQAQAAASTREPVLSEAS